jgi:hypothetical protein
VTLLWCHVRIVVSIMGAPFINTNLLNITELTKGITMILY